ncbi:methyltransferase [Streptomyces sp. e14]|nr:methyltransferase [Streptomyces sp. e14]
MGRFAADRRGTRRTGRRHPSSRARPTTWPCPRCPPPPSASASAASPSPPAASPATGAPPWCSPTATRASFGVVPHPARTPKFGLEVEGPPPAVPFGGRRLSPAPGIALGTTPQVVVAHKRTPAPRRQRLPRHTKVAVLTAPGAGPAELGLLLDGVHRTFVICEELGTDREQVTVVTSDKAADHTWRDPNVVIVIGGRPGTGEDGGWIAGRDPAAGPRGWTQPAEAYGGVLGEGETELLRAAQLARLGPRVGDLVWDIGCGSGAFTAEAARSGAAVIAVDHDPDACARTEAAARSFGVQAHVVLGDAPHILENLPEPDVVRVGGGGSGRRRRRRRPPPAAHRHARRHPRRRRTHRPRTDRARLPRRVRPPPVRPTRHPRLDGDRAERRVPAHRGTRPRRSPPLSDRAGRPDGAARARPVIGLSYRAR